MKRQSTIIAIFALLIFAFSVSNANAQFGDFIKKAKNKINKTEEQINQIKTVAGGNQSNAANDNWVTFSKIQATSNERSNKTLKQFGCGDSIYATANFSEAIDASEGFTVSILVDDKPVVQERMNGGAANNVTKTINVELVPDDTAQVRFPTATIIYAETLLTKLSAGNHLIQLAVSMGGDADIIARGKFQFNNASGCKQRFERAKRKLNKDIAELRTQTNRSGKRRNRRANRREQHARRRRGTTSDANRKQKARDGGSRVSRFVRHVAARNYSQ